MCYPIALHPSILYSSNMSSRHDRKPPRLAFTRLIPALVPISYCSYRDHNIARILTQKGKNIVPDIQAEHRRRGSQIGFRARYVRKWRLEREQAAIAVSAAELTTRQGRGFAQAAENIVIKSGSCQASLSYQRKRGSR